MSLLDRLIGRAVSRLPSRRGPVLRDVSGEGLLVGEGERTQRVPWHRIERVVATSGAGVVGDTALLAIELPGGAALVVPETDAQWAPLTEAVDAWLLEAEPSAEWRLHLLSAPDVPRLVYQRPASRG